MKQGSTDDPFAEEPDDNSTEESAELTEEAPPQGEESSEEDIVSTGSSTGAESVSGSAVETQTLPYIYARDSVKDGRQQRPIFLRDEVEDGIPTLVDELESRFGETVYRTDVLEAAVVVAQENPDLVEDALEEWGYGWQ